MSNRIFDVGAYFGWLKHLSIRSQPQAPELVQASLADEGCPRAALMDILVALEREPPGGDEMPGWRLIERICIACRTIVRDGEEHPGSDFIKEHFLYHDAIVAQINGSGLCDAFAPFALRVGIEETNLILETCLLEFVAHIGSGLVQIGMFGQERSTAKARAFVVNGFYRTGSTKVFLAGQAILKVTGRPYVTLGMELSDIDKTLDRLEKGAFAGKWILIKTHQWMPLKKRDNVLVFFTRRNLADVASSHFRRSIADHERQVKLRQKNKLKRHNLERKRDADDSSPGKRRIPKDLSYRKKEAADEQRALTDLSYRTINAVRAHQFINDYVLPKYDLTIIDYEEFADRDVELLQLIAKAMDIALSPEQLKAAAAMISVERVKEISEALSTAGDPETFIQRHHVSKTLGRPRSGLHELPQRVVDDLKHFGLWPDDVGD